LDRSSQFYEKKSTIQSNQLNDIKETRKHATENSKFNLHILTPDQIKIRKQIRKRYLNTIPHSLVD